MTRRRSLALLPIGLLLLTFAEIAIFVAVVHAIGAGWAMLALGASSILGLVLLRREGIKGWRAFRATAEAGRPAGAQVSNSLVGLLGALLLAVPGFLSAVTGLLLVLPPMRGLARRAIQRATERHVSTRVAGDLFGPRRVRVRRGEPTTGAPTPAPTSAPTLAPEPRVATTSMTSGVVEGDVVEGEIVR